jgi:hypothetical protein
VRAQSLLARIAAEKEAFDIEIGSRRAWLEERFKWVRLARHYQAVRKRYERRYKQPLLRPAGPLDTTTWGADFLMHGADGQLLSTTINADYCLRHHPMLSGIFALDKITGKMMLLAPLPNDLPDGFLDFEARPVTQGDVTAVQIFLQSIGLQTISRDDTGAAIKRVARQNALRMGGDDDDGQRLSVSGQNPPLPLS